MLFSKFVPQHEKACCRFLDLYTVRMYVGNFFPHMNYIKNRCRTRLTDDSLQSCVKMAVYTPHVRADALN